MFREVTMIELKEVLRLWGKGLPKKPVAAQLGLIRRPCGVSERGHGGRPAHGRGHPRRAGARRVARATSGGRAPARRRLGGLRHAP